MLALRLQMGNIQASDSRPRHLGKLLLMRSGEGGCLLSWSLGRCPPAGHIPALRCLQDRCLVSSQQDTCPLGLARSLQK